jgi:hypothetical protein
MHNVKLCFLKGRGDQVTISEIKTKLVRQGSYLLPRTARLFLKYNKCCFVLLQYLIIIL